MKKKKLNFKTSLLTGMIMKVLLIHQENLEKLNKKCVCRCRERK